MSALQWALLVVGAAAVIAIYIISRREKRLPKDWTPTGSTPRSSRPAPPGADQMEMFGGGSSHFDEFGVGKPRRVEPGFGEPELHPVPAPSDARQAPALDTPVPREIEEKIVTLLIAERQGATIDGRKIHQALLAQHLAYGERKIYHRLDQGRVVYSVASLIKPGTLDPTEVDQLATPGLSVFMVLPGPTRPRLALQDMIATTRALAEQLNADVYDGTRQPFNNEAQRVLATELEAWARRNGLS